MTQTDAWFRGPLQELSPEECLSLVSSKNVGRLAYLGTEGIEVLPLNYVVHDGTLLFRTSPHTSLGRRLRLDAAALEVDEIDDYTQSGWSVLIRGRVEPVDVDELPPSSDRPQPWPAGQRPLHLRLAPRTITGRRLLPG